MDRIEYRGRFWNYDFGYAVMQATTILTNMGEEYDSAEDMYSHIRHLISKYEEKGEEKGSWMDSFVKFIESEVE